MTKRTPSANRSHSKNTEKLPEFDHRAYLDKKFEKKKTKSAENKGINRFFTYFIIGLIILGFAIGSGMFSPNISDTIDTSDYDLSEEQVANYVSDDSKIAVTIYSSPTCGCCHQYVDYAERNGMIVNSVRDDDILAQKKIDFDIPATLRSCHTMEVDGKFIEGHIPLEVVYSFLNSESNLDGLTLPGMPAGSPGMGGEKDQDWNILGLLNGEQIETFATL